MYVCCSVSPPSCEFRRNQWNFWMRRRSCMGQELEAMPAWNDDRLTKTVIVALECCTHFHRNCTGWESWTGWSWQSCCGASQTNQILPWLRLYLEVLNGHLQVERFESSNRTCPWWFLWNCWWVLKEYTFTEVKWRRNSENWSLVDTRVQGLLVLPYYFHPIALKDQPTITEIIQSIHL